MSRLWEVADLIKDKASPRHRGRVSAAADVQATEGELMAGSTTWGGAVIGLKVGGIVLATMVACHSTWLRGTLVFPHCVTREPPGAVDEKVAQLTHLSARRPRRRPPEQLVPPVRHRRDPATANKSKLPRD